MIVHDRMILTNKGYINLSRNDPVNNNTLFLPTNTKYSIEPTGFDSSIEIQLDHHRYVYLQPSNKVQILKKNGPIWIEVKDLKVGDKIITDFSNYVYKIFGGGGKKLSYEQGIYTALHMKDFDIHPNSLELPKSSKLSQIVKEREGYSRNIDNKVYLFEDEFITHYSYLYNAYEFVFEYKYDSSKLEYIKGILDTLAKVKDKHIEVSVPYSEYLQDIQNLLAVLGCNSSIVKNKLIIQFKDYQKLTDVYNISFNCLPTLTFKDELPQTYSIYKVTNISEDTTQYFHTFRSDKPIELIINGIHIKE